MLKKTVDYLSSLPMTIVSGVFLLASLILILTKKTIAIDPAMVSVLISGSPLLYSSLTRLIKGDGIRKISSALLISIAMIAAVAIGDVFAAAEVAFIMAIGEILEGYTAERSKKGLNNLIRLAPQQGRLIQDGKEQQIAAASIEVGDMLRVLPGETIPVDGQVVNGQTSINQAVMTGESLPVDKATGDLVYSGTINQFGSIDFLATKVGEDSSLQKLIRMVGEAENKKASIQRIADKWATWLVPLALLIALVTFLVSGEIVRSVTVLVVFCPCALVMATPTAIMAAIGQATKHGIIIKSGEALENMGKADLIAFDKTGTLTHGLLQVSDIISLTNKLSDTDLLELTARAEIRSEHPVGKAIVAAAKAKKLSLTAPATFRMEAGRGIRARIDKRIIHVGNDAYLAENGIDIPDQAKNALLDLRNDGKAAVLVASDDTCIAIIGLADTMRPTSPAIVSSLHEMGIKTVLLTGDNDQAATYFAQHSGIDAVKADLLPSAKVNSIGKFERQGYTVCMVGDGVNDAPALKAATVSVAVGTIGSDIAIDAADIALMNDDISRLVYLKRLSIATIRTIRVGIFLSLFINVVAILLSFLGWLTPTTGALVHNAGAILVIFITSMLYGRNFD